MRKTNDWRVFSLGVSGVIGLALFLVWQGLLIIPCTDEIFCPDEFMFVHGAILDWNGWLNDELNVPDEEDPWVLSLPDFLARETGDSWIIRVYQQDPDLTYMEFARMVYRPMWDAIGIAVLLFLLLSYRGRCEQGRRQRPLSISFLFGWAAFALIVDFVLGTAFVPLTAIGLVTIGFVQGISWEFKDVPYARYLLVYPFFGAGIEGSFCHSFPTGLAMAIGAVMMAIAMFVFGAVIGAGMYWFGRITTIIPKV